MQICVRMYKENLLRELYYHHWMKSKMLRLKRNSYDRTVLLCRGYLFFTLILHTYGVSFSTLCVIKSVYLCAAECKEGSAVQLEVSAARASELHSGILHSWHAWPFHPRLQTELRQDKTEEFIRSYPTQADDWRPWDWIFGAFYTKTFTFHILEKPRGPTKNFP